jgi:hypothetical protein
VTEPQEVDQGQSEPTEAEKATATEDRKQNPKLERRFSEITKQREAARARSPREREARESGSKGKGLRRTNSARKLKPSSRNRTVARAVQRYV